MTSPAERPLLFLDVDGTIIPFTGVVDGHIPPLDPALGARLLGLGCELVWATAWMDEANDELSPRLGLPKLPVVIWPDPDFDNLGGDQVHWKTRDLVAWAAGRPFIWVDDEITDADRDWVTANHGNHALLHRVRASVGLTDGDLDALRGWLRQV
jgi:hypothetical protein